MFSAEQKKTENPTKYWDFLFFLQSYLARMDFKLQMNAITQNKQNELEIQPMISAEKIQNKRINEIVHAAEISMAFLTQKTKLLLQ